MIIIKQAFKDIIQDETYIALGSFDGLHKGHISLINKTKELSKETKRKSMLFTFRNHPLSIINKERTPKLIMDNNTKLVFLDKLGIDIVCLANFNRVLMEMSRENFIENLIQYYNVKGIIVGFNYRFGYKNLGDVSFLSKLSNKIGFELNIIDDVKYKGETVSSSKIRNLIEEGNIEKANFLLSHPYILCGDVVFGNKIGRTIEFPTINLNYNKKYIIPKGGVYYTNVEYDGFLYKGITNIGYNPTVHNNKLSIETHILGFSNDIYGKSVKIFFIKRIRDEIKFENINELKNQLKKDKQFANNQK